MSHRWQSRVRYFRNANRDFTNCVFWRTSWLRIFLLLCLAGETDGFSASTMPVPPSAVYSNTVAFNFTNNIFDFFYQGTDGSLVYEYAPKANGSLHQLTSAVNGTNAFLPSNYGGLSLLSNNIEIFPWYAGVSFKLLNIYATNGETLFSRWNMSYGTNHLIYTYQFSIVGRTLAIQVATSNNASGGLYLDRCEKAISPMVVHVPELTTMNVLLCNGVFTSMFIDWETSDASTFYPLSSLFTETSAYFAQQAQNLPLTDGSRRNIADTIYLTVSPSLHDVLPSIPNPVSSYKTLTQKYLVFDNWQIPFSVVHSNMSLLAAVGITNLWLITHVWQSLGYDDGYPDVLPANSAYGGDAGLKSLSQFVRGAGGLFSLHENYLDFYPNAASWNPNSIALNGVGSFILGWTNKAAHIQSYELKPSQAAKYLAKFAPQIHDEYTTTASYLDVHSGVNPSQAVDYDAGVTNAGICRQILFYYRALGSLLRDAHQGPVSGEGGSHMFYVGYFDDIEAQLNCGCFAQRCKGNWLPLMVDFDLLKVHDKALTHGVGYYERFYCNANGSSQFSVFSREAVLGYIATELAYGRGGFIPTPSRVFSYVQTAQLEQWYVLPVQELYANAHATNILYHDPADGSMLPCSDYIRRYPTTFSDISSSNFLSQVQVTYDNGLVVCVNRHPSQPWQVTLGRPGGWFDYNAEMNGTNAQWTGITTHTSYLLPATNGWVVYAPQQITPPVKLGIRAP